MIKYFCDRCGKEIGHGDAHSNLKINPNVINDRIICFDNIPAEYEINLCPDCFYQFNRFIKMKKNSDAVE